MMPPVPPTEQEQPAGPPDADNDGVSDAGDLCPDSAEGATVDAPGCDDAARIVLRGVNFETDSAKLTDESLLAILDGVSATPVGESTDPRDGRRTHRQRRRRRLQQGPVGAVRKAWWTTWRARCRSQQHDRWRASARNNPSPAMTTPRARRKTAGSS